MATIEIPKVRKESTVIMYVSLTDNGVTVDWTSLSEIKPFMYSDEQHCIAGKCTAEIVTGSPETLIVRYPTTAPQFLGQNSLLIRCTYDGNEKSFDVPVLEFVDRSSEATGVTVIEDPELPVAIEVQDVDTSVLDDAIAAALDAAAKATAAAELVPLDILAQCQAAAEAAEAAAENCAPVIGDNGNWWIYDYDAGEYVDSGKPSRGIQGEQGIQGIQGIQGNTGSSVDYPYELVNNRTTDDATKGLSAAEGKRLGDDLSQLDQKVDEKADQADLSQLEAKVDEITEVSARHSVSITKVPGLKMRQTGFTSDANAVSFYFRAKANVAYLVRWDNTSSGIIRSAQSSAIPAVGNTDINNYKTDNASVDHGRTITPSADCYIIIACDTAMGTGDPTATYPNSSGIGHDVYELQGRMTNAEQVNADQQAEIDSIGSHIETFPIENSYISDGSDSRYPAGTIVGAAPQSAVSPLYPTVNISKLIYSLIAYSQNAAYAIAFYDEDKAFISGLKSDYTAVVELDASSFPEGTAYIRVGSVSWSSFTPSAKFVTNKDLVTVANNFTDFKKDTDNGILAPLPTYWAVCGDSITHANHAGTELAADDVYRPIDDYTNKPGYSNARSGAYPNYAYHFCKRHRMQWANYGYGGTILGEYIPKYQGENNLLYPFVGTRITQFKEGIPWNYISIMFGWNDNVMGPVYQKDKWLSETYGGDIGYPYTDDLIGTDGFATQEQKDACDALGDAYFFDAFIGSINDTGKDTWYGAWNYALGYLMREYPDAKVMIMCPFIGGTDRTNSQKFRASVKAVAEKFGVACFDFNDLEWWYFTTVMNSTPFPNPDRQDGRWVKHNGDTTPATVEGFNRARFCWDSVHPSPLGYKWIADPIGYTLLQK